MVGRDVRDGDLAPVRHDQFAHDALAICSESGSTNAGDANFAVEQVIWRCIGRRHYHVSVSRIRTEFELRMAVAVCDKRYFALNKYPAVFLRVRQCGSGCKN